MHEQQTSIFTRIENLESDMARLGRQRLRLIRELDLSGDWDYGEFRSIEHWVACHLQISWIDAKRRVDASHAIESGELSLDKTVHLTRFATAETEQGLVKWSQSVSLKTVRDAADAASRYDLEDARNNDRLRNFGWRLIEGGTAYSFFGALPVEQGAVVVTALDRLAESIQASPAEELGDLLTQEPAETLPQRRADALVLSASHQLSQDSMPIAPP